MSTDLYPDGDFTFVDRGGEYADERGKVHWPALLRLELTEAQAWEMIHQLARALQYGHVKDGRLLTQITLSGSIERQDEDGNRIAMDGGAL